MARREKQIEFPPNQTHTKSFEYGMFVLCFAMIIAVILIVTATDWHSFIGPW